MDCNLSEKYNLIDLPHELLNTITGHIDTLETKMRFKRCHKKIYAALADDAIFSTINPAEYTLCMIHYAHDNAMLAYLIQHESAINKNNRLCALRFFGYTNTIENNAKFYTTTVETDVFFDALDKDNAPVIQLCFKQNIPINEIHRSGQLPLHTAARYNKKNTLMTLLDNNNIDVNMQDNHDNTALHYAVMRNNPECVARLLIHPNIDVTRRNFDNNTPLDEALINNHTTIIHLLLACPKNDVTFCYKTIARLCENIKVIALMSACAYLFNYYF